MPRSHYCRIEKIEELLKEPGFYSSFQVVVCGLDSVPARRWMNQKLMSLVKLDDDGQVDPSTIVAMIDGGSEGASVCLSCCGIAL